LPEKGQNARQDERFVWGLTDFNATPVAMETAKASMARRHSNKKMCGSVPSQNDEFNIQFHGSPSVASSNAIEIKA
jgi:hypothetical protein